MGILSTLRAEPVTRSQPAAQPSGGYDLGWASGLVGADLLNLGSVTTAAGVRVSQVTAMQVAAVRRAVSVRSLDFARCKPGLARVGPNNKTTPILDHPVVDRFRRPNPWQSTLEFWEQLHVGWLLKGNAYFVKLTNPRGYTWAWLPINPDLVTLYESPGGFLFYNVARAGQWLNAQLRDQPVMIPETDVFHLRDISMNTLLGLQRITLARSTVGLNINLEEQAARWAGNGARPAGILSTDKKLDPEAAIRLKRRWTDMQSGLANVGSTAVLEDGVKWSAMQINGVDLQFIAQREFGVKEIARLFDVPLHKLMETGDVAKATITELNADYVSTTVMGDLSRYERRMEHDFGFDESGVTVKFDESELLRADITTQRNNARLGVLTGLITPNEGRQEIGYGPSDDPDADKLQKPNTMAPNGSDKDGTAPGNGGRPPNGQVPGAGKPTAADGGSAAGSPTKAITRAATDPEEAGEDGDAVEADDVSGVEDDDLRDLFHQDLLEDVLPEDMSQSAFNAAFPPEEVAKAFDESKHPRGRDGRWGSSATQTTGEAHMHAHGVQAHDKINVRSKRVRKYAGHATVEDYVSTHKRGRAHALRQLAADHKAGKISFDPGEAPKAQTKPDGKTYTAPDRSKLTTATGPLKDSDYLISLNGSKKYPEGITVGDFIANHPKGAAAARRTIVVDRQYGRVQAERPRETQPRAPLSGKPTPVADKPTTEGVAGIKFGDDVSDAFKSDVATGWAAIPKGVKDRLKTADISFSAPKLLTDTFPNMKGVQPRGWGEGRTWDEVDGCYNPNAKTIVAAQSKVSAYTGQAVDSYRVPGVVAHETGHALDHALGNASESPYYRKLYDADLRDFEATKTGFDASHFAYFTQPGNAGPSEMFAEQFAITVGPNLHGPDLVERFPRCATYMKSLVSNLS